MHSFSIFINNAQYAPLTIPIRFLEFVYGIEKIIGLLGHLLYEIHYICRQNLNSDFTDSALGSSDKSPLPYGNFQLRDTTVQSILNHPRYGPK